MTIRTNHTVEYLESRIVYFKESMIKYPKYKSMLEKDLEEAKLNLEEASNRRYCGVDDKGAKAYITDNVLWVEDKPSGWSFTLTGLWSGKTKEVCYDGGTNWTGIITFY